MKTVAAVASAAALAAGMSDAHATEAAFGRYIPGVFATPGAGIVPPEPGFYWQSANAYYHAETGRTLSVPIGGTTVAGLDVDFLSTTFTGIWNPGFDLGENLSLAFGLSIPIQYMNTDAALGPLGRSDDSFGIGDIALTPVLLGWRQGTHFASASLRIFAPTGPYDVDSLANIGLNYWTFSPNLAYTYIDPAWKVDYSITGGLDFNTENEKSDYRSGTLAHLDASVVKSFDNGLGIGAFGSVLYQIEDDEGDLADRLGGFRGRSFAIGPMLTYAAKFGTASVNMSLSWAPEFDTKNRLEGDGFYLNLTGSF